MLSTIKIMPHEIAKTVADLLLSDYKTQKHYWDKLSTLDDGKNLVYQTIHFLNNYSRIKENVDLNEITKFRKIEIYDSVFIFVFFDDINSDLEFNEKEILKKIRICNEKFKHYILINMNLIIQIMNNKKYNEIIRFLFIIYSEIYKSDPLENTESLNSLMALISYIELMYIRIFGKNVGSFKLDVSDPIFKAMVDMRYANYKPLIISLIDLHEKNSLNMLYYNSIDLEEISYKISKPFYDRFILENIINEAFIKDVNLSWRNEIREIIANDEFSDREKFEKIFVHSQAASKVLQILYSFKKEFIYDEITGILSYIEAMTEKFPKEKDPDKKEVKEKYDLIEKEIKKLNK